MTTEKQIVEKLSGTYNELPYTSKPFSQTHPGFLQAACSLFDVDTPPIETANILEIGCSFGGNIIPLALQYPKANIIGLDISEKQVSTGKAAIKTMGLKNIQLQQQDVTTYKTPTRHFDYIICHGVYSWVPEPVKAAILQIIADGLTEKGVAIVSYNTYPGWKIREVYRDAMLYRSQPVDEIREKIRYGFGMLDFLKEHLPKQSPWGVAIEQHYQHIREASWSYLAHEYFEVVNEPCYFHEFMHLAQEKALHFVAEADYQNHFFPPVAIDDESYQAMKREADGDIIKLEQLNDFLSNRTFRQTILSRNPGKQNVAAEGVSLQYSTLSALHIQGSFAKKINETTNETIWESTLSSSQTQYKDTPTAQAVFRLLNETNGQTIKVDELWAAVKNEPGNADKNSFFGMIAEIVLHRSVRIRSHALTWQFDKDKDKERNPCVSLANRKLFRWLQAHPDTIGLSTVFHEPIELDIIADELLPIINGRNSEADLCEKLIAATEAGRLTFYDQDEKPLTDNQHIVAAAKEHTERLLAVLKYNGLLI